MIEEHERDAFSTEEFARRHGLSRNFVYRLWQRGEGPRYMQIGDRRFVSKAAAEDWRAACERATQAQREAAIAA
jgi:predicted DNA-binding transcriptional regulator AlpA